MSGGSMRGEEQVEVRRNGKRRAGQGQGAAGAPIERFATACRARWRCTWEKIDSPGRGDAAKGVT